MCIQWFSIAISTGSMYRHGWSSHWVCRFTFFRDSIYIVARPVNVCIDFNRVGIASGRISLLYCYCIWLSSQSIFVFLLIAHILRWSLSIRVKFIGTVLNQPLGACIFSSIWAVLRQPLGVWVYIYINMTILILPLGAWIEIATGLMSLRDLNATGRIQWDSHWTYGFIFLGTVLI